MWIELGDGRPDDLVLQTLNAFLVLHHVHLVLEALEGSLESVEGLGEQDSVALLRRVAADVVEEQGNLGAVLHRGDEQVGELQALAPRILRAPLARTRQTRSTF